MIESVRAQGTSASEAEQALADALAATRDELRLLRKAAQLRAVIEQAKGVLVERHGITLDEAFARLRAMSQEHNVRLVEVAATMVGVTVPPLEEGEPDMPEAVLRARLPISPAASKAWNSLRSQPDVRSGVVTALLDSVAGATSQGDEAAQLLTELLASHRVAGLTLYRTPPTGHFNWSANVGSLVMRSTPGAASRRPATSPTCAASRMTRPSSGPTARPAPRSSPRSCQQRGSMQPPSSPWPTEGRSSGVAGLLWESAESFGADRVEEISRLVQRVAPLLLRNTTRGESDLDYWLDTLLHLHLDPWLLLEVIPRSDGTVGDFVVLDAAQQIPGGADWLGHRLLELWPSAAGDGMLRAPRRPGERRRCVDQ